MKYVSNSSKHSQDYRITIMWGLSLKSNLVQQNEMLKCDVRSTFLFSDNTVFVCFSLFSTNQYVIVPTHQFL